MTILKDTYNKDKNTCNYFDRVEVGGSNPSTPTKNKPTQLSGFLLIQELSFLSFIFCIIDQKTIAIPAPKLIPKEIPSPILSKILPKGFYSLIYGLHYKNHNENHNISKSTSSQNFNKLAQI